MNSYDFTLQELKDAKWQLTDLYFPNNTIRFNSDKPIGILLGGQPASGKTKLFGQIGRLYPTVDFIEINGDEYRQYHPRAAEINEEYGQDSPKYTQPFSNSLVEFMKAECLRLRSDFIIEGTMRTYKVIERTAQEIKKAGFLCEAHSLAVAREESLIGIFLRFERDKQRTGVGRFSPIEIHDEAYLQIPLNLTKASQAHLFDRVIVYTRQPDGQLLTGLDLAAEALPTVDFSEVFDRLRQPIFEPVFYAEQWLVIKDLAHKRGETDTLYLKQIDEFINLFKIN